MNKPELIFYNGRKLNEAMFWDKKTSLLYFCAIRYNLIYAFDPKTGFVTSYKTEGPVGGAVTDKNGMIIEAEKSGIYSIDPASGKKIFIKHVLPYEKMRYNHLILDSRGRILVDVVGDEERCAGMGGLYQIYGDDVKILVDKTTVANGIALSEDETKLYFTDTVTKTVLEFDYDIETGNASNERIVVRFSPDYAGKPDGVMLGKNGSLWIAEWDSGIFSKWDIKSGEKLCEISLPSAHVTSSCIGGENGEYIYIATAKREDADEAPSGGIFRIDNI